MWDGKRWEYVMRKYTAIERKVRTKNCKILNEWQKFSKISDDDFLEGVRWLLDDPLDVHPREGRHTREIGLTPKGWVKLSAVGLLGDGTGCVLYEWDSGVFWSGAVFRLPCSRPEYADGDGHFPFQMKISLSSTESIF